MWLIIGLFAIGLLFLFIEIYFTPGATIFGIIGLLTIVVANVIAFNTINQRWAWVFLMVSFFFTLLFLFLLFRMLSSKQFSVQSTIEDKVNEIPEGRYKVGEQGMSVTALRPEGNARFGNLLTSVYSSGDYIEPDVPIEITSITINKIFVKPITK